MRNVLVMPDDKDPDVAQAQRFGIMGYFYDLRYVTAEYLQDKVIGRGFLAGVYAAWNWAEVGDTGPAMADWVAKQIADLKLPAVTRVQFDIEAHDPEFVRSCLFRWRLLEPTRGTSWTLESFQGGWFTKALVDQVKTVPQVRVVPQLYYEPMTLTHPAADRVVFDLQAYGIPRGMISSMYPADSLPDRWDGFAYHQGLLPA